MSSAHKPGPLKQQNKAHKTGKHRSKSAVETAVKGRVAPKSVSRKGNQERSRQEKRNQLKQLRQAKRQALLTDKRGRGVCDAPPHVILVVPLDSRIDGAEVVRKLCSTDPDTVVNVRRPHLATVVIPRLKRRYSFLHCPPGHLYGLLDAGKVADTILFVLHANCCQLSAYAETCLSCLVGQGVPACAFAVEGLSDIAQKGKSKARKAVEALVAQRFPKEKLMNLDAEAEIANLLRSMSDKKTQHVSYRDNRPSLVAEDVQFVPSQDAECSTGCLQVSGYVRSRTFDANRLVHVVGVGDFQMSHIDLLPDPCTDRHWQRLQRQHQHRSRASSVCSDMGMDMDDASTAEDTTVRTIQTADPESREPLVSERVPESDDDMDDEQDLPTEEEIAMSQAETRRSKKHLPQGTSDYQAAWIMGGGDDGAVSGDDDDDDDDGMLGAEMSSMSKPMDGADSDEDWQDMSDSDGDDSDGEDGEEGSGEEDGDDKYDAGMDMAEEEEQLRRLQAQRDEEMFPDEVDTPANVPARLHFGGYRGLESFRASPWDHTEGTPADYRRIFQFQNYKTLKKAAMNEEESQDGALPSWYVTLHIIGVSVEAAATIRDDVPLVVFGLLQHEHKMSVLNFSLTKHPTCALSIQAEDDLIFHCGWRRFTASALFSQHTTGNKHKAERFLPASSTVVASVYGPICYAPIPVLVFKNDPFSGQHFLVGTGSLLGVNPNRLIIQKAILSGHPYKINRRVATIRFMFNSRDDIMFFKPVELWSKHGRRGHIKDPLGTHGHMKCMFNRSLKAQDTVCMSLYKRVFPKWTFSPVVAAPQSSM